MMEFTCGGLVRQGFGFYNPNHAAALICAFLPFLWSAWFRWSARKVRIAVLLVSVLLMVALAMTFSRTGMVVFGYELLIYLLLRKGAGWKVLFLMATIAGTAATGFGLFSRFVVDASLVHRFEIWKAGLALFGANPWFGVGLGNSGNIASAFLLPDGITCRTLVNSHLTLLAEFGLFAGFPWLLAQGYAFLNSWRYPAVSVSLTGLSVSAFTGSVFDWHVLSDCRDFGGLTVLNFALSWVLLVFFLALMASILFAEMYRNVAASQNLRVSVAGLSLVAGCCAVFFGFLFCFAGPAPKVENGFIVAREGGCCPMLILYDDLYGLKQVKRFLPDGDYRLPVRPWEGEAPCFPGVSTVMLFGECASYASEYPDAAVTLIAPPKHYSLPPNASALWVRRFQDHESLLTQAKEHGTGVVFF